ncbi:MAG: hypothetical protein ACK5Z2_12485 [Bacteroidota bacterium]|jgi:hypothetical protein
MENNINNFVEKMWDTILEETQIHPIDYLSYCKFSKEIQVYDFLDFIAENAKITNTDYFSKLLIYSEIHSSKISSISLKDWYNLFNRVNETGVKNIIIFLSKYLQIDGYYALIKSKSNNHLNHQSLLEIKEYPIVLTFNGVNEDELSDIFIEIGVHFEYIKIKNWLLEQGAIEFKFPDSLQNWELESGY